MGATRQAFLEGPFLTENGERAPLDTGQSISCCLRLASSIQALDSISLLHTLTAPKSLPPTTSNENCHKTENFGRYPNPVLPRCLPKL